MGGTQSDSARLKGVRETGLSLVYHPRVPDVETVEACGSQGNQFAVTLSKPDEGWLELLQTGLSFDLSGFNGGMVENFHQAAFRFGFEDSPTDICLPALALDVAPNLASGRHMLPIVRAQMKIGLCLADIHGCEGVVWQPAGVAMSPAYFKAIIGSWIGGGAFPALGLTALSLREDGSVASRGLKYFTGRELRLNPIEGPPAARMRLAVRLVDHLVHAETLQDEERLLGPDNRAIVMRKLRDEPLFEASLA